MLKELRVCSLGKTHASPGDLLGLKILSPTPDLLMHNFGNLFLQVKFSCMLRFEKHCLNLTLLPSISISIGDYCQVARWI